MKTISIRFNSREGRDSMARFLAEYENRKTLRKRSKCGARRPKA